MKIIKRNGAEVDFDISKIVSAIEKANMDSEVPESARISKHLINAIAEEITTDCLELGRHPTVEEVQDMVENYLIRYGAAVVARSYIKFRFRRELARKANSTDDEILSLIELSNEDVKQENSNKNPTINSTARDYMAGLVNKDLMMRVLLPKDIVEAHKEGILHYHDMDFGALYMHNCCLLNLEDMLQYGTVISGTKIEPPKSFHTACNIATQVVCQVAANQYGGQTMNLAHLVPFVEVSRQKLRARVREEMEGQGLSDEVLDAAAEKRLRYEIKDAVQLIQYQLVTFSSANGQSPFVTVYMHLNELEGKAKEDYALVIEEVLKQRIRGLQNEQGVWITPAFPKLIYVLDEDNTYKESPYFYLTELSARCTAKRMVPDYISAKIMRQLKNGDVYGVMGCRSALTPDRFHKNISRCNNYVEGKGQYWGRWNQGVVTINLPDAACASYGDMDKFWDILEERLELCHKALRFRHDRLKGTKSDRAPILWQHGALARLNPGETIDEMLYDGYSTLSLGFTGLYECCMRMTGKSHTDPEATPFAIAVMQKLNDKCAEWKAAENIDYSVYGTPMEQTTERFAKLTRKHYGVIKDVTDHNYQTNSYHVVVREEIDAFSKISFEATLQQLSPGGAITYVEVPNMCNNIPAVIEVIQHIYETIMYAELNTKSDYCQVCGYDSEIQIVEDENGKLIWECPNCKNRDHNKMNVARRVCGYISTYDMCQGRLGDVKDRVLHL